MNDNSISDLKVFVIGEERKEAVAEKSYLIYFSYTRKYRGDSRYRHGPFISIREIKLSTLTDLVRTSSGDQDINVVYLSPCRPDICLLCLDKFPGKIMILPKELYEKSEPCLEETDSPMQFISFIVEEFAEGISYRGEAKAGASFH